MSLPSLHKQVDKARSLLSELQQSLSGLPPACQKEIAQELDHFAKSLEDCMQAGATIGAEPEDATGPNVSEGQDPLRERQAHWLEDSLSEVRVGAWRWNLKSGSIDWSLQMYKLHGFSSTLEPMNHDCYIEMIDPQDRSRVAEKMKASSERGIPFSDEYRVRTLEGKTIWVGSAAEIERDASGKPEWMSGIAQDITDRKLAEEDLHTAKEREQAKAAELEAILDAVPALVWIARDPECREMIGSRYGYEFLGMWKGANLSKSATDRELALQPFKNYKDGREIPTEELPMQVAAATGKKAQDYEFDVAFEDGRIRNLFGNVIPLLDREGKPNGAVGAFVDITERKRIENEHLQNEKREQVRSAELQAVIDAVPTPIFLTYDANGLQTTGNLAAYRSLHAEPGSNLSRLGTNIPATPIRRRLHLGADIEPEEAPMVVALRTGKPVEGYEAQLTFEDGSEVTLWGNANPLFDPEGKVSGAVGVFMDVTSRIAAENALRRIADRDAYRITLADALRRLTDPEQIKAIAAKILGKRLGASRVFYASVATDGEDVVLEPGYVDGVPPLTGRFRLADFSRNLMQDHPNGQPYAICDIPNDPKLTEEQRAAYLGVGVKAHLDVPLIINGKFATLLSVHQSTPRQWTEDEVALIVETAERTWASVERARAEAALRESEARFHASIEALRKGFILYSAVREARKDGKPGKIIDLRFEYVNAAACQINHRSREQLLGHTLLEVLPGSIGRELFRRYSRVIRSGDSLIERLMLGETPDSSRVFDIHAVRLGDGLVVTRADVTDQVQMEHERQQAITQMEIHHRLAEQSEKERQSYARELHDGPIQTLASIAYNIQYIQEVFPDPALKSELEQIGASVRSAVQELRQVINELRPPSVIRLGLTKTIELQIDEIKERAPHIQWIHRLEEDDNLLPTAVCLALFRIYQEGINNIVRHSEATKARISFRLRDDKIVLEIKDNGKGLPLKRDFDSLTLNDHFGLAGMSERAEAIGGKLEIISTPGCGTKLRVVAPFRREAQANPEQRPG